MIVTLDGPTASGKSTIAQSIAKKHNWYHINSGLLYRAIAHLLVTYIGYNKDTITHPQQLDVDMYADPQRLVYEYNRNTGARVLFDGIDITPELKKGDVDAYASLVSTNRYVRDCVNMIQRYVAQTHDVVVDGRDVGSIVFPDADVKFFLTASIEVRAKRWLDVQQKKGLQYSFDQAQQEIVERDTRDTGREIAPLIIPEGAVVIDSSDLNVPQTIAECEKHIAI